MLTSSRSILDNTEREFFRHLSGAILFRFETGHYYLKRRRFDRKSHRLSILEFILHAYQYFTKPLQLKQREISKLAHLQYTYLCIDSTDHARYRRLELIPNNLTLLPWSKLQRETPSMQSYVRQIKCLDATKYLFWLVVIFFISWSALNGLLIGKKFFVSTTFFCATVALVILSHLFLIFKIGCGISAGECIGCFACCCSFFLAMLLSSHCYRPLAVAVQMMRHLHPMARAKVGCDIIDELYPELNVPYEIKQQILEYILPTPNAQIATQWLYPRKQRAAMLKIPSTVVDLTTITTPLLKKPASY